MRLRRRHIVYYLIMVSFFSIGIVWRSFDRFSRNSSINLSNRYLIENYLSDSEIEYLIDENIDVDLFLRYIRHDNFILQNYLYYTFVAQHEKLLPINTIIDKGNQLVELDFPLRNLNNIMAQKALNIEQIISLASVSSPYYPEAQGIYFPNDLLAVSNSEFYLYDFKPHDLVSIDSRLVKEDLSLRTEANEHLSLLCNALSMVSEEYCGGLSITQSFVSFQEASNVNLVPGHNEFQLGNTIVFMDEKTFLESPISIWIYENIHNFGFVLRYPSNKEEVTGYSSANVFRYVGIENARRLFEKNRVVEELS